MALNDFTFADVYRRNANFHPDRTAFCFQGRTVTHAAYLRQVERLAAGLLARASSRVTALRSCRKTVWKWST